MTKKIAEKIVKGITDKIDCNTADIDDWAEFWGFTREEYEEFLNIAVKAIEPKPYEKFESTKDHIYKLAGDYKCWDNRLTEDEAVELCHILEQQPCEDKIIEWKKDFKEYVNSLSMLNDDYKGIMEYIDELPVASQEPCENAINIQAAIDIVRHECGEWKGLAKEIVKQFNGLPPVQPKYNPDEWCKTCSEYNQEKHCCPRYNNVIRNAVEEMKQSCEDAVSREDAIGAVANLFEMSEYPHPYPQGKPIRLREIKEKLKQLPPVQPKIKTGQWFLLDECSNSGYYCSECHKKLVKEGWSGTVKKIKFCPNCGAKMIEPQESEE